MIRGMGIRLQDAFQGPFKKKKPPKATAKASKAREVENLESDVRVTYLSSRQLEEAASAERFLLENLDHGSDFKKLFYLKHQFLIVELQQPVWCDLCGTAEFICIPKLVSVFRIYISYIYISRTFV